MCGSSDLSLADRRASGRLRPKDLGFGPLFWVIRDAVIVSDLESGRIVLWNPAAERMFGYSVEEAIGLPVEHLFPERLRDQQRAALASYKAGDPAALRDTEEMQECPALQRSGAELFIEFSVSPLNHSDASYILAIVRDCTQRKQIEAERDTMVATAQDYAKRVSELAALKADFMAMVVHELGAPLAAIRALTDLLDRDALAAADRQHVLATIRTEADLLQRLVADIHLTASFERNDFAVHCRPTIVATLLAEATSSLQGRHSTHEFHLEPAPVTLVMADPERIGQVLRNLLANAVKHTPPGTPITVRASQAERSIHFEVADEGPGIHPDDLTRIFQKFGRGRDSEGAKRPGTGLGLYLCRRIVEAHGGELVVTSELGKGATSHFDLEKAQ
jgi:PAS domain S-box-containing protein